MRFYIFLFVSLIISSSTLAQVFKTQKEALKQAFPDGYTITRKVLFLTDEQVDKIQKLAKSKVESKLVTYYVGSEEDTTVGYAFFETKIVRTKPVTFMLVVNPNGTIRYVDILAFYEPLDYIPTSKWLDLFKAKILNDNLWPRRDIHHITGATLTVQAITQEVRKILAIYQIAIPKENQT